MTIRGIVSSQLPPQPPSRPAPEEVFAEQMAQDLVQFGPYQGDPEKLFSRSPTSGAARESEMLPNRLDVHDWVDHCLFGRALTVAGDSVSSYDLRTPEQHFQTFCGFILANIPQFQEWQQQSKPVSLNPFLDVSSKKEFAAFSEIRPRDMKTLTEVYEDQEAARAGSPSEYRFASYEATSYFKSVQSMVDKRRLGEDTFTAKYELALSPWVKQQVESLLWGQAPPQEMPERVSQEIQALNRSKSSEPGWLENATAEQLDSLRHQLSQVKAEIYTLAGSALDRYTGTPEKRQAMLQLLAGPSENLARGQEQQAGDQLPEKS